MVSARTNVRLESLHRKLQLSVQINLGFSSTGCCGFQAAANIDSSSWLCHIRQRDKLLRANSRSEAQPHAVRSRRTMATRQDVWEKSFQVNIN